MTQLTTKQAKAVKDLHFNPWVLAEQIEPWLKSVQWHGPEVVKKKLAQAGFNLPLLLEHLKNMVRVLSTTEDKTAARHTKRVIEALATGKPIPTRTITKRQLKAAKKADDKQWMDLTERG